MKKLLLIVLAIVVIMAAAAAWVLFGVGTGFSSKKEILYIRTNNATKEAVLDSLSKNKIVNRLEVFEWAAGRMNYWNMIKPGKYEITKGSSIIEIIRKLRNGDQTPVKLVITKLRTKEDLARLVDKKFESDSLQMTTYFKSSDFLQQHNIDSQNILTLVLPDTYEYFWNSTPQKIFDKIIKASEKFWTNERKQKAAALSLMPSQAYTLASIVEEETNADKEKSDIASVYLNRISKGMPLQADPTVKFALKDFGLRRIYFKHLAIESPYNTYKNKGLPPGPICTPSRKTIDAVLNANKTDYLYFVASPEFDGTHLFSNTYDEHQKKAKQYQEALNKRESARTNTAP
ncbi:MAG TPA: endolytic transglycosylase MltG [Chitinophagaceae bacterium]